MVHCVDCRRLTCVQKPTRCQPIRFITIIKKIKIKQSLTEVDSEPSIGRPAWENVSVTATFEQMTRQNAQLSQRDGVAWCNSFGQKWKNGTGRQYFTDIV